MLVWVTMRTMRTATQALPMTVIFFLPVIYCFSDYSVSYTCCCYTIFSEYLITRWRNLTFDVILFIENSPLVVLCFCSNLHHTLFEMNFLLFFITYLLYHNTTRICRKRRAMLKKSFAVKLSYPRFTTFFWINKTPQTLSNPDFCGFLVCEELQTEPRNHRELSSIYRQFTMIKPHK